MFDVQADVAESFVRGDVVKVEGIFSVDERFGPQLKVRRIRPMARNEYEDDALVPVSPVEPAELAERLDALMESVRSPISKRSWRGPQTFLVSPAPASPSRRRPSATTTPTCAACWSIR